MKVLILSSGDIFTARWTNAFVKMGYEVHLAVQEPIREEFNSSVRIHFLPFRRPYGAILNALSLRKLLKRIKPDLLHVFGASQDGLLGRLSGFHPAILSVLGSDVFDFPYHSERNRKIVVGNIQNYDWIGSTSSVMRDQVKRLNPSVANITVTPFGVETMVFLPERSIRNPDFITIGTVKGMNYVYGIDLLLKTFANAFNILQKENHEVAHKLRLLIAGEGSNIDDFKKLAVNLGIQDLVEFTGFLPNSGVPGFMNKLDIFIALSRRESFGVAVVEASSCALPVLVSNAGGLPEVVNDGVTGFIVESENVESATEKLLELILNKDMRLRFGDAGRKFVIENYEWRDCVDKMKSVYSSVLKEKI